MPDKIYPSDSAGSKWLKLQRWVKQACENAGITAGGDDPLLSDINPSDSEGVKWSKLQRWVALLAENVSGGTQPGPTGPQGPQGATGPIGATGPTPVLYRTPITQLTVSRDIAVGDAGSYLYSTSGSAIAITVQSNIIPVGAEVDIFQGGSGQISFVAGSGVTIVSKGGNLKLSSSGSGATIKRVYGETYHLVGDLTA